MIVGEALRGSGEEIYTASASRQGKKGAFLVDVIQFEGALATLSIEIQHKNKCDEAWKAAGSFATITTTGTSKKEISNLLEETRLKLTLGGGVTAWVRVAILPIVWS
jgi:hypothetical protein